MRLPRFLAILVLAVGCSDGECPADFVKVGKICRHCPEGTEKMGESCAPLDGSRTVDTVVTDSVASDGGAYSHGGTYEDNDVGLRPLSQDAGSAVARDAGAIAQDNPPDASHSAQDGSSVVSAAIDSGPASTDASLGTGHDAGGRKCFLDRDKDGVGAGNAVDCDDESLISSLGSALAPLGTDCDDNNAQRSPNLTDICGDTIDNDCDGKPDDESNNACGGPCTTQLAHRPGEVCSNGLKGACEHAGTYQCEAMAIRCNAPNANPGTEICGDRVDNDCDGSIDEADASDVITWYQDCDSDGFAAATAGSVRACTKPAAQGTCSWTAVLPRPETHSNWDCDDSRAAYKPAAGYALPSVLTQSFDFDCDGQPVMDPSFVTSPQACPRSIVDHFNRAEPRGDCPVTVDSGACLLWKDTAGRYQPTPATACPDASFRVVFSPFDPCYVSSSPGPAIWPCR